ncbi:DUF4355 domain-containing protein [Nocardia cyriacigeorgica]|uniref:capsid assembly scaffolding protein Gp46 family protein n=1 Tax=Nocardia cyriacigeorgica TaxID=135487 RepID=UPI0013BE5D70|nr:DUF4355 domain-containing protein [Nocardia cyriacigeorgica]NEW49341.1 DUF4355 domain-containing protein [Nocardia cyriacigeorgica]
MHDKTMLPVHPITGLQAIGYTRRGPIWPVLGGSGEGEQPPSGESGKTFTQAELDRIVGERLNRQKDTLADQYKDFDTYKAAADELAKLKDGEKSDLERLTGQLQEKTTGLQTVEQERDKLAVELQRRDTAAEQGLTDPKLIKRISGSTAEEILADVKELKELQDAADATGMRIPQPDGQQGRGGGGKVSSVEKGRARWDAKHNKK